MATNLSMAYLDRVQANGNATKYRAVTTRFNDIATLVGSGAGAAVVTTLVFSAPIPADVTSYSVHVTPNQDAVAFVTSKTVTGCIITLNPRLATNTLAAGTMDITVTFETNS